MDPDPQNRDTAYLVLYDTDPANPATTGLEMGRLVHVLLPMVRVPNSLVLLDACHAGFAAGVKRMRPAGDGLGNRLGQTWAGLRGRMVLAACAGEAVAREDAHLRHGIFTYYLLRHWQQLEGYHPPGCITVDSLKDYIGEAIRQSYPQLSLPTWSGAGAGPSLVLRHIDP